MPTILHVSTSPRAARSKSLHVAQAMLEEHHRRVPEDNVVHLDLFATELPAFDGPALDAKYQFMQGQELTDDQREAWHNVERVIEQFTAADKYVFSTPMWNFGIPYKLKHYVDVLVQPGYTFSFDPATGYTGLVTGKPVIAIYARGGDYSSPEMAPLDLQKPYLETILGFIGLRDVHAILIEPTLAGGPEVAEERLRQAIVKANETAEEVFG